MVSRAPTRETPSFRVSWALSAWGGGRGWCVGKSNAELYDFLASCSIRSYRGPEDLVGRSYVKNRQDEGEESLNRAFKWDSSRP